MKKILLLFLLFIGSVNTLLAQDRQIQGIIFDSASKQRLTRVYIYDTRNHKGIYNNAKGEFTLSAREGDTLVVALQGYRLHTVTVQQQSTYIFYLMPTSILLPEAVIKDTALTPDKQLEEIQKEYKDIYRIGNSKDLLTVGSGGAGLGIDAIYSLLSRQGNNARHLQEIIENDYKDAIINYRFNKTLVNNATTLSGDKLTDFMRQYRPNYFFVLEATDYAFVSFIRESYIKYLEDPSAYRLPPLK